MNGTVSRICRAGALVVLAGLVLAAACGCRPSRAKAVRTAQAILPASLRSDRSEVRALALAAYRDLAMAVPEEELLTIAKGDLDPARFAAVLVKAEQARRAEVRFRLLSLMWRDESGGRLDLGEAETLLSRGLQSHGVVRAVSEEIFRGLRRDNPGADLKSALADPGAPGRLAAMKDEAGRRRGSEPSFFETVFREDSDASVRLAAVYGLARLGDFRYMQMLADGLVDSRPPVRRNAAMILGLLGNRSAGGMLKEHLADADPVTRLNVAEAMARLGDRSGLPVIRSMIGTDDHDAWWQVGAILTLGRVGESAKDITLLREIEGGQRPTTVAAKLAAFGARAQLGDYSQAAFLAEAAGGKFGRRTLEPQDRAFALQLLARSAYGPAWHEVTACLDDRDPSVRLSAAWALLSFNTPRADQVKRSIAGSRDPQMLTEREVLRPVVRREPADGATGPLDVPGGDRGKSSFRPYFP